MLKSRIDVIQDARRSTVTPRHNEISKFIPEHVRRVPNERGSSVTSDTFGSPCKDWFSKHRPDVKNTNTPEITIARVVEARNFCCNLGSRAWIIEVHRACFVLTTIPSNSLDGSSFFQAHILRVQQSVRVVRQSSREEVEVWVRSRLHGFVAKHPPNASRCKCVCYIFWNVESGSAERGCVCSADG